MSFKLNISLINYPFLNSRKNKLIEIFSEVTQREPDRNFLLFSILMTFGGATWGGLSIYLYSDGFQDQFGGEKLKKFMPKRLKNTLFENRKLTMEMQLNTLENTFSTWKKSEQQTDDVLVMGFRIA